MKDHIRMPSQDILRANVDYDPATGLLTWKTRGVPWWDGKCAGKLAFNGVDKDGYLRGKLHERTYMASRIAWKWMTGEDPIEVDHINRNVKDNRFSNLRSVTASENSRNKKLPVSNKSGHVGVYHSNKSGTYSAFIKVQGRLVRLGNHTTFESAVAAREAANIKYGFHPNHGKPAKEAI